MLMKSCLILKSKYQIQLYSTNITENILNMHQIQFYVMEGKTAKMQSFPELFLLLYVLSNKLYVKRIHNKHESCQGRFTSQHKHSGKCCKHYILSKFSIKKGLTKIPLPFCPGSKFIVYATGTDYKLFFIWLRVLTAPFCSAWRLGTLQKVILLGEKEKSEGDFYKSFIFSVKAESCLSSKEKLGNVQYIPDSSSAAEQ